MNCPKCGALMVKHLCDLCKFKRKQFNQAPCYLCDELARSSKFEPAEKVYLGVE